MPRQRSETTLKKVEFAQGLVKKDVSIKQKDLSAQVINKFGTGLDFRILANVQKGRDPFAKPRGRKKAGKKKAARKVTRKRAGKKAAKKRATRGRKKKAGRRGRRPASPFSGSPAYVVVVPGDGIAIPVASKAEVRAEVARLVDGGVAANDVVVYGREKVKVETKHIVRV